MTYSVFGGMLNSTQSVNHGRENTHGCDTLRDTIERRMKRQKKTGHDQWKTTKGYVEVGQLQKIGVCGVQRDEESQRKPEEEEAGEISRKHCGVVFFWTKQQPWIWWLSWFKPCLSRWSTGHRQTTCLHPALSGAVMSIFLQLYLKPEHPFLSPDLFSKCSLVTLSLVPSKYCRKTTGCGR